MMKLDSKMQQYILIALVLYMLYKMSQSHSQESQWGSLIGDTLDLGGKFARQF